jgi:nucleotide-binding universal stress UspA family protein
VYLAVLVALDGSQAAASAIPPALELAAAFEARLVLLTVVPAMNTGAVRQRDYDAQRFQAEGYLESLRKSLGNKGVKIEAFVRTGDPATEILAAARSLDRSIVVITAFGRTPPQADGDLGTVAQEVLHSADGPVVLVRPQALRAIAEETVA